MSDSIDLVPITNEVEDLGTAAKRWRQLHAKNAYSYRSGTAAELVPIPAGGTIGQVLKKYSGTDYDYAWKNEATGGGGDMLASTYDPIIKAITGESTVGATPDTTIAALWALPWTEKIVLNNPASGYVSVSNPLSRNGIMASIDFYVLGTPSAATTITISQNGTANGQTVSLSAAGKTTLTFSTAVTGAKDDLFTLTVGSGGLSTCTLLAVMKWVNR